MTPTLMTKDEADNNLRQAIIDHAVAYDIANPDTEMLNHYAVIAHWQKIEANGESTYTSHFHTENTPHHIALGLFRVGIDQFSGEYDD